MYYQQCLLRNQRPSAKPYQPFGNPPHPALVNWRHVQDQRQAMPLVCIHLLRTAPPPSLFFRCTDQCSVVENPATQALDAGSPQVRPPGANETTGRKINRCALLKLHSAGFFAGNRNKRKHHTDNILSKEYKTGPDTKRQATTVENNE
jgi:hypothetical protein